MQNPHSRFELRVMWLLALIQFINIWDFIIVLPLGPDFARLIGIDTGHFGWVVGAYSLSATFVGVSCARFIDRFDRKRVLLVTLGGLALATLSMVLATSIGQLIAVRIITGLFGGPMIATTFAVLADVFPEERRGEALGKVMGSFSLASILGVPLGLELARRLGMGSPFLLIALTSMVAFAAVLRYLPPMRHHLDHARPTDSIFASLRDNPATLLCLLMTAFGLFGSFLLFPNIAAHVQLNMGYPHDSLGLLYFCGGAATLLSMRLVGRLSDRIGTARTALYATLLLIVVLYAGFYAQLHSVPVLLVFTLLMVGMSTRNVAINALLTRVPKPQERAGFMSLVSSVQHLMSGVGALFATLMLRETGGHALAGMDTLAVLAMAAISLSTVIMFRIEWLVRRAQACSAA